MAIWIAKLIGGQVEPKVMFIEAIDYSYSIGFSNMRCYLNLQYDV